MFQFFERIPLYYITHFYFKNVLYDMMFLFCVKKCYISVELFCQKKFLMKFFFQKKKCVIHQIKRTQK